MHAGSTAPPTDAGAASGATPGARTRPPGLRSQLGSTREALVTLVKAHVDLAKAEGSEIAGEVKVVAAGVGIAIGALLLVALLLPIGLLLFLGEWLFGSLGWGVLHGVEALVLVAVVAVVSALRVGRPARAIGIAFLVGAAAAILFGTNAPNLLYTRIAEQFAATTDPGPIALGAGAGIGAIVVGLLGLVAGARNGSAGDAVKGLIGGAIIGAVLGLLVGGLARLAADTGSRPLVVGVILVGVVLAVAGAALGARSGGPGGAVTGLVAGLVLGGLVGAFSAITFPWHVAIAIGIAVFLGLAIGLLAADVASRGVDTEELKQRFYPRTTIDTTKETIEWAKARIPRGPRS